MPEERHPKHADQHAKPHEPAPAAEETAAGVAVDTAGGAIRPSAVPASAQSGQLPGGPDTLLRKIFTGSGMVSVLAVLLALVIGGLLIAATDERVGATSSYLFARPTDFLSAVWDAATRSYVALSRGPSSTPGVPAWPPVSHP